MKRLFITPAQLAIFVLLVFVAMISCKKNATTSNNNNNNNQTSTDSAGWSGLDTPSTVPQAVNVANLTNATLPTKVDLSPYLPPVLSQGGTSTCIAWATGYYAKTATEAIAYNYSQSQLANAAYQISPLSLFCEIPDADKAAGGTLCRGGTGFKFALDVLQQTGAATMNAAPWSLPEFDCAQSRVQSSWLASAVNHKIAYYRTIPATVQGIKQELASNIPVLVGIRESNEFKTFKGSQVMTTATFPSQVEGHAQCIVGYDDSKGPGGAFRVVNSWGTTFGDNGFYWVDYNLFVNQMIQNGNAYYMATSSVQNNDTIPTQTTSSVVDIATWIATDVSTAAATGVASSRRLYFNIFNVGGATASASATWNVVYAYVNAFNANDYGVIYHDQFNTSIPSNSYSCPTNNGCIFNYNIPGGSSLAKVSFGDPEVFRDYIVPNITGTYYLVLVADLNNALGEKNMQNNIFYKSGQLPLTFSNGVTQSVDPASGAILDGHKNDLEVNLKNLVHSRYNSAVSEKSPNAYTPEEIISFLKVKYQSGELKQKAIEAAMKHARDKLMPQVH